MRDETRKEDGLRDDDMRERLQGLRESSDERDSVEKADGVMLCTSERFNAGLCEEISRSITTESKNGVVEWKK